MLLPTHLLNAKIRHREDHGWQKEEQRNILLFPLSTQSFVLWLLLEHSDDSECHYKDAAKCFPWYCVYQFYDLEAGGNLTKMLHCV